MDANTNVILQQNKYYMRTGLAPGNLDPNSKFLPLHSAFQGLFTTDTPNHVFFIPKHELGRIASLIDIKRGIRPHIYDDIFTEFDIDSNLRANRVAFFISSMSQPLLPFIMLTTTRSPAAIMYFRKSGMTLFSFRMDLDFVDYNLTQDWEIAEMVTRTIYVREPGVFGVDMWITPDYSQIERLVEGVTVKLRSIGLTTSPHSFITDFESNIRLPYPNYVQDDNYVISLSDAISLTQFNWTDPVKTAKTPLMRRKFLVAPSGSGKSFWLSGHIWSREGGLEPLVIDADTLFVWPKTNRWWEDPELAEKTNNNNLDILKAWLNGPSDSAVVVYADTFDGRLTPDAIVLIPEEMHKSNLRYRVNTGQPGIADWDRLRKGRDMLKSYASDVGVRVFENFSNAFGFLLASGRIQIPNRSRFFWKVVFPVNKKELPDFRVQTAFSVQTNWVKSITYFVSRILNFGNSDMEIPRRIALVRANLYPIAHTRISGFYKYRGRIIPVAVSGHMVNYIILSTLIPLDLNRLFDQIKWNYDLFLTRRKLSTFEAKIGKDGLFAEILKNSEIYSLWHNVPEWILGMKAGIIFAGFLGLDFKLTSVISKFADELELMGKQNPKLFGISLSVKNSIADGFNIGDWLSTTEIGKVKDWSPLSF